jgi:hypothetical protein
VNATRRIITAGLLGLTAMSGGCGGTTAQPEPQLPDFTLSCAAVLPAVQGADLNQKPTAGEENTLHEGITALNQALRDYFGSRTDIRMISDEEQAEETGKPRTSLTGAKAAAEKAGCNAILETTLHRYKERIGGEYTAKEPSSVSFSYRLLALPEGTVLCRGRVDEEQEPLMSNLLKFRLSAENAFTWVKAEQLLSQNLREQFNDCSFLAGKK